MNDLFVYFFGIAIGLGVGIPFGYMFPRKQRRDKSGRFKK